MAKGAALPTPIQVAHTARLTANGRRSFDPAILSQLRAHDWSSETPETLVVQVLDYGALLAYLNQTREHDALMELSAALEPLFVALRTRAEIDARKLLAKHRSVLQSATIPTLADGLRPPRKKKKR
jgi:hypothetical protein